MPSPFPGMDPYLEHPGLWPDVHHELISVAREVLNRQLRPNYHVRIEERVYSSDEDDPGRSVIIPELRVRAAQPTGRSAASRSAEAGMAVAEPIVVTTLIDDELREARLEVVDRLDRSVVTVIEILSPTNKVPGSRGRRSYQQKRREVMQSPSRLVEIDLLRMGEGIAARETLPPCDYLVHVSCALRRPRAVVWPIQLAQRLPAIPIPLRADDRDVPLDLQAVLDTAYQRAGYDLEIDYGQPPEPPLKPEQQGWAGELLEAWESRRGGR